MPSGTCTAVSLSTNTPCKDAISPPSPLFCDLHRKQCQSLYAHYKKRQSTLESLELASSIPDSLPSNLERANWASITSLEQLSEIHAYLFRKLILLRRCILARDIHHSHFYRDNSDFGHQAYLDRLRTQRRQLEAALEKIGKRLLEVRYENAKWMDWVKELEAEDDAKQEAEKKKVRAEAKLYKEYLERVEEIKAAEQERIRAEVEQEEVWDPIEDVVRDQRVGYVALVRALLEKRPEGVEEEKEAVERAREVDKKGRIVEDMKLKGLVNYTKRFGLDAGKRKRMDFRPVTRVMDENGNYEGGAVGLLGKKGEEDELYEGTLDAINDLFNLERGAAGYLLNEREATLTKMEEESRDVKELLLLRLIAQKPHLLRVALNKQSVDEFLKDEEVKNTDLRDLALALANPTLKQLRNACADYWVERELFEEDEESTFDSDEEDDDTASVNTEESDDMPALQDVDDDTPEQPKPPKEKKAEPVQTDAELEAILEQAVGGLTFADVANETNPEAAPETAAAADNGNTNADGSENGEDVGGDADSAFGGSDGGDSAMSGDSGFGGETSNSVTICNTRIYNYAGSTKEPLPRKGWFQFVLMTGCTPDQARSLCMTFKELKELELLMATNYFHGLPGLWSEPDPDGVGIGAFRRTGIVPYEWNNSVGEMVLGKKAMGKKGLESRGIFCAYLDRNEQAARRFVKWAESYRSEMLIYAIDGVNGSVISQPPKEECWLLRTPAEATNRAGRRAREKNPNVVDGYNILARMDEDFVKALHKARRWQPECKDYIEVIIWDQFSNFERPFEFFFNRLMTVTNKAFKHKDALGQFDYCLKIYKKYLYYGEEDDKRMQMINRARRRLRRLRRNRTEAQLKGANPKDYYNEADFEVDRYFGTYDTSSYWETEDAEWYPMGLENIYAQYLKDLERPGMDVQSRAHLTFDYIRDVNENNWRKHVYKDDLGPGGQLPYDARDNTVQDIAAFFNEFETATPEQLEELKTEMQATVYSKTDLRDYWAEIDGEVAAMEVFAKEVALYAGQEAKSMNPMYGRLPATSTPQYAIAYSTFMVNLIAGDPEGMLSGYSDDPEDAFAGGKITLKDFPAVIDMDFRAKHPPTFQRPREISEEALKEWDEFQKEFERDSVIIVDRLHDGNGPIAVILATIASLWRAGLAVPITPSDIGSFPAIAGRYEYNPIIAPLDEDKKTENNFTALRRFLDPRLQAPKRHTTHKMFIDYRDSPFEKQPITLRNGPTEITLPEMNPSPTYILDAFKSLSKKTPNLHFSLLRLRLKNENMQLVTHWDMESPSMPPLTTPEEVITDPYGRYWRLHYEARESPWNWRKFHATVHHLLVQRAGYGDTIRVRGDLVLVWAKGKEQCMKRTVEVACAVLKPKMGVMPDWGKCWIARSKEEMEGLNGWWWEQ